MRKFSVALIMALIFSSLAPQMARVGVNRGIGVAHAVQEDRGVALRPVAPGGETVKGTQWLLVIGIDKYLFWPHLKTAVNDARAMRDVLLQRYHFYKSNVIELFDENATRKNILGALRDLTKKVQPDDSLLIYYAGHGHIDSITKKGSWIPIESGTDDPSAWISNQDIKDYLNIDAIKAKHVLLVSDSCFSGDFFRGSRGAVPEVTDVVIKKAYELSSRQAITSGGLEPVADDGFGGNSVFAHFLITALASNTKPYLIPSELFPAVKSGVAQNAEQFPQMGSLYGVGGQEGGEMVLFLKQEDRLQVLSADAQARLEELELLQKIESESSAMKQREQTEIARKEKELAELDKQIAEMKERLGSGITSSSDSLDSMIAKMEQKEVQARRLEQLKQQREDEAKKRTSEIDQMKRDAEQKRFSKIKEDLAKYEKIAASNYGKDMKVAAWHALIANYPEAKAIAVGDTASLSIAVGLMAPAASDKAIPLEFVHVPAGCFRINSSEVCVDAFTIGKYEVTQGQWEEVMGSNPSHFSQCGKNCPVDQVSWNDVQQFIRKLNSTTGKNYRLPSEAEWEFACRSGGKSEAYCGEGDVDTLAWYDRNSDGTTHKIGLKKPNGIGISDMSGNVWEWCQDWYGYSFPSGGRKNPTGPSSGSQRVSRGGSWFEDAGLLRSGVRTNRDSGRKYDSQGFRLAGPPDLHPQK